ncbi:MAG TPA: polyphenol oxidase family protein [Gemmatimonadales bacterium]
MTRQTELGGPASAGLIRELPVPGEIPRFEVPGWRDRYGVLAGITGRDADSPGFDLGLWTDQPVGAVMERWRRLRRAEPGFHATVLATQVHGTELAWHRDAYGWLILDGFDGHATSRPGLLLTVTVADCIPVYLVDPVTRTIGLLHAGWRGTAAGILARGVEQLLAHGASLEHLILHCGVGICGPCYEVGQDVMTGCGLVPTGNGPWHLDLRRVLLSQATAIGIRQGSSSEWCSAHHGTEFYSHRRSRGSDGRMVAYLGLLP